MVEPILAQPHVDAPRRRRPAAWLPLALCAPIAFSTSGCGLVSRNRLNDCQQVARTLRSDNARLKDVSLKLRTENQDLSQRAIDDARRLASQEDAINRLEENLLAYQADRDRMTQAFETLKQQIHLAVDPRRAQRAERLRSFAESHPGWSFNPATIALTAPAEHLFNPGGDQITPHAGSELKELADALTSTGADDLAIEIVGHDAPPSAVQRAGFNTDANNDVAAHRFLTAARAARVRERLVEDTRLSPDQIRLANAAVPPADDPNPPPRRLEVRVVPREDQDNPLRPSPRPHDQTPALDDDRSTVP